jgi:polyhydroxyalkanoate synthesis repressor PhaR
MNRMADAGLRESLQIKKYPNRRFYDTTRSCHITLQDIYDLVLAGHDVTVSDSRTGEDITNIVLFQVMLEKDPPKLDLFPSSILHLMIRSNRQALRAPFERFFGPFMQLFATSQRQFDAYMRRAMGPSFLSPLDWANRMMQAFTAQSAKPPTNHSKENAVDDEDSPSDTLEKEPEQVGDRETLEQLRRQVESLAAKVERLNTDRKSRGLEEGQT